MGDGPILLYDGTCGLCDHSVRFVLRHDRAGRFRFAALQSDVGGDLLERHGLRRDYFDSLVLIDGDGAHTHSDGALRIVRHLPIPWRWAGVGRVVPRRLRDWAYGVVARWRYRVFGKVEACRVLSPEERGRFLDAGEVGA